MNTTFFILSVCSLGLVEGSLTANPPQQPPRPSAEVIAQWQRPGRGAACIGGAPQPVLGWEGVLACFLFPGAWPLAAAHVLFFCALGALLTLRWRPARNLGIIAFALGACFGIPFLLSGAFGQIFKLSAMGVVAVSGWIGARTR